MEKYKQKLIQHLGIVAGICNEIELIKTIDNEIEKPKRKVTVGQAVQSIILNALGFDVFCCPTAIVWIIIIIIIIIM